MSKIIKINKSYKLHAVCMIKKLRFSSKIFKASIKSWSSTKKFYRKIQFNQEAFLKPYIGMNTKLRRVGKNDDLEKDFFNVLNNSVFGKAMKNVRKHRNIKLVTKNKRKNYLVS